MSENVTIIFYPYIYNNKIDFAGKKTYTHTEFAVDVLSKSPVTIVTKRGKVPILRFFRSKWGFKVQHLQIILNFTKFCERFANSRVKRIKWNTKRKRGK